ncbi:MAG: Ig-like domain-containing protein [Candidatus Bathyarchaeia archaeon]|nr:MAG: hypothetical protein C0195_01210 [Candidatus Bathyarchaeota archaeon]
MKKLTLFTLAILIILSCLPSYGFSETIRTYQILNHTGGKTTYGLTVAVQQSLYDYYASKSHKFNSISDFPKFVTPYAVKPIADRLWEIYADDEDFANGVLMMVHQIPYCESEAKYPVETIVENVGDCDVLSYMAASIMIAGRLDVILIYYESQSHMNIGVHLSHVPHDARYAVRYVLYNGVKYYIAECTGDDWISGWRVGECPPELVPALNTAKAVTLKNCEQTAPEQVSASYRTLTSSTLSLSVSSPFVIEGSTIILSGQLSPVLSDKTVTIYLKAGNSQWITLGTAATNANGEFFFSWTANLTGICFIRASWSGDNVYAGADSPTLSITILSVFFFVLLALSVSLAVVCCVIYLISRQIEATIPELQSPEVST